MKRRPPGHILHWRMYDQTCLQYVSLGSVFASPTWYGSNRKALAINTPREMGKDSLEAWHTPESACVVKNPFRVA